jgi:DNA-binding IclR family transcriptional regulator
MCQSVAGHAILSQLDPAELERYVAEVDLAPLTPATITEPRLLRRSVDRARTLGYAFTAGERSHWAAAVAAPVLTRGVVVGALGVCGPQARFPRKRITNLAEAAIAASAELTAEMS